MDVGTMLNSVIDYQKVFTQFGYKHSGTGTPAWSHRASHDNGSFIDYRASDWTYTGPRGNHTGRNTQDLKEFLLEALSREDLIKMLLATK